MRRIILAALVVLFFLIYLVLAPPQTFTNQFNQSGSPLVVNGTVIAGTPDNLNDFGINTFDIAEVSDPVEDGILAYGRETVQLPNYRLWNNTNGSWSANYSANSVGATIEWVELASSPVKHEYILVTADALDDVKVQINSSLLGVPCWHNGSACWGVLEVTTSSIGTDTRKADVAYEQLAGDAMVVYSDGTNTPKVRIWNGTNWTSEFAVNDSAISDGIGQLNITGAVEHVKLVSRPVSDEIALVYATDADDLNVLIWNGTRFNCESNVLETGLHGGDFQKFDADYEQLSVDLFIGWGFGTTADLRYATKNAGTCTFVTATQTTFLEIGMEVSVAAQSGSDYIMVGEHNGGTQDDAHAGIWNGTAWLAFSGNEVSLYSTDTTPNRLISSSWAGESSRGVFVYSDAVVSTVVDYFVYNKTDDTWAGGSSGIDFSPTPALSDEENNIRSYSFLDENKSFVFIKDEAQDLWAKIYNGDTDAWSDTEGGATLEGTVSSLEFPSFDYAFKKKLYAVDVWHNSTAVGGNGTIASINTTIRFNSTVAATYNLSIYNWGLGIWNATPCEGVIASSNVLYQLWCNITQNPSAYVSSDNVVRIRINNTPHRYNGTLIEDYVQFYVTYNDTVAPRWQNNGSNTTTPSENNSVLLFAQGNDEFLAYAVLETNESGVWQNKSGFYGSPMNLLGNATWTWSNFTWRNTSVLENTQVCWRIWYNDSSDNRNGTDINCFTVQPPCSIVLGLSANLTSGINWTIASLPASNEPALGNNDTGNTTYNVTISASGCNAALWIRANDHLKSSDGDFIGIGNETYRWNQTNATVPGASYASLALNDALVTSPLSGTSTVYFKFFLNVSAGQPPGSYNNTVYFKANRTA